MKKVGKTLKNNGPVSKSKKKNFGKNVLYSQKKFVDKKHFPDRTWAKPNEGRKGPKI
ncbi:MAG: hypothetical protein UR14_C0004G0107 [candidate division TM6 bacterium GW2011_GWE2_31_21]|nr:MAG: hypothetical protein UR14_C0004G0107 [candidate division TM6 bacterium GW2011_GWE2_31_21]KKP53025.1 MAG: hypothetical protein UR43_C0008G0109 [candidate division TM6 bacterium GW2011_GWF2_33_332]